MFESIDNPKQRAFLVNFARLGSRRLAATASGICYGRWRANDWRLDPDFQEAYRLAQDIAAEQIEDEFHDRAMNGQRKYKFSKDGAPISHPDVCECGHDRSDHVRGPNGSYGPCIAPESSCDAFTPRPYYELDKSDYLLSRLAQANLPGKFGQKQRIQISGILGNLDYSKLPDDIITRLASGENPISVLGELLGISEVEALPPGGGSLGEGGDDGYDDDL